MYQIYEQKMVKDAIPIVQINTTYLRIFMIYTFNELQKRVLEFRVGERFTKKPKNKIHWQSFMHQASHYCIIQGVFHRGGICLFPNVRQPIERAYCAPINYFY